MVGSAIVRRLSGDASAEMIVRSHQELDLTDQRSVREFFLAQQPDEVYLAAARVGGIHANNSYPADFIWDNLMMEANIIRASFESGVRKLLFLGSSCIYPREAPQPMREEVLLSGHLEATNEPYAVAKIAGIKLCESFNRQHGTDFRSIMPTNLYGPGDNYHAENAHVIPALIRRFHDAKVSGAPSVTLWGSGTPRREFMYVDDMAAACVFLMDLPRTALDAVTAPMRSHLNAGTGTDVTILELAGEIARAVGYGGEIRLDPSRPDGTPRKLMDSGRLHQLGWKPLVGLSEGLVLTYTDFTAHHARYTRN